MDCMCDTSAVSHVESRFEVDAAHSENLRRDTQDPRVRTRVVTDADLAAMIATGKPPQAVKSSLKRRTDKGGLLGKAGLRGVDSTGMPAGMVNFAIATHTAPVVMPVGMMLYGAGSKVETENDPMASQFGLPHSGLPGPEVRQMPDAPPATGNLSLYRCSCCCQYVTKAEFGVECTFHTGRYKHHGHSHFSWSCCGALDEKHPGCKKKTTHTEDVKFSEVVRSIGSEIGEEQLQAQAHWMRKRFPGAYADGHLAVEVKLKGGAGESILLRVLAPPQPSIGAVKTLLQAADSRFVAAKTELATSASGDPLLDNSALTTAPGLLASGVAVSGGCTRALILYTLQHTAQMSQAVGAQGQQPKSLTDREGWVKVPLRWGDSLQKLSLKYDLPVAVIKSANNIVGSEIEGWRDELWLPPSAELGQAPKRPQNKYEEFIWLLRRGAKGEGLLPGGEFRTLGGAAGASTAEAAGRDDRPPTPEKAEVEAYLAMNDQSVEAAFAEWKADTDWEDAHAPLCAPAPAPAGFSSGAATAAAQHIVFKNPMNELGGVGRTDSGTVVVAADRTLRQQPVPEVVAKPDNDEWLPSL